jgi:CubicO group peptidase (beta-lactamase class C family)
VKQVEDLIQYLQTQIEQQRIPGAVLHISHDGRVLCQEAAGYACVYPQQREMRVDTVFDLASLTKVVATLPSILKLIEKGKLDLFDPVCRYVPEFAANGKENIQIIHLLTHTSGLVADRRYHLMPMKADEVLASICAEELHYEPNTKVVYSDLGMILLYQMIERVAEESFDRFVQREIFEPLEMYETGFNPSFPVQRYATTEYADHLQAYKAGVVHDEKAEFMGGVSGHAGLFSTVQDLVKFCSMIENNGLYKGRQVLSAALLAQSRKNYTAFDSSYRGLGWELKSDKQQAPCGELFSPLSYGHTGFTGTSIWFDARRRFHVILLTNRVHFGRKPDILEIRPTVHRMARQLID